MIMRMTLIKLGWIKRAEILVEDDIRKRIHRKRTKR